ncbi:hypothetical protein MTO96_026480 [Rhipicephalus appendiculatus]
MKLSTYVSRREETTGNTIENAVGAPKVTRFLVLVVSLIGALIASCVMLLVVGAQEDRVDCGKTPNWDMHVDSKERIDICTGKPCTKSQCDNPVSNDTCRGVVRPYADRCRCCEACVLHLGKNSDCSNRPSDLHDVRECGPGLFCNQRTCICMEFMANMP